jgi:WD40 repeat protein
LGFENGHVGNLSRHDFRYIDEWQAHHGIVRDVMLCADTLISCGEDNMTQIYLTNGDYISGDNSHGGFVTSLTVIGDNLFSASYDGYIRKHPLPKKNGANALV